MKLKEKLFNIRNKVKSLEKDQTKRNGARFEHVSENKLLQIFNSLLEQNKVSLSMTMRNDSFKYQSVLEPTKAGNRTMYTVMFEMEYTFIDLQSEETLTVNWPFIGNQTDPSQALGTALTYNNRYFLMKYFGVANGSDDVDMVSNRLEETPMQNMVVSSTDTIEIIKTLWRVANKEKQAEFKALMNSIKPTAKTLEQLSEDQLQMLLDGMQ